MNRLLEIGFQPAGHWLMDEGSLRFDLLRHSAQKNILYAFVCDGEVKYVGKTIRPLAVRLAGYRTPGKSQTTNMNNHRRIKKLLAAGVSVEIFALPDNGHLRYGQFHLNLAAGLEDDLIRVIDPEWNGGTREPAAVVEVSEAESNSMLPSPAVGSFTFTLQPTYYRTGFFNVGASDQECIGADGETIELYLGNATEPVLGYINRRANQNRTPRIMGGAALRDWFRSNFSLKDTVTVAVHSLTEIRLT